MTSPRVEKINMRAQIVEAIRRDGKADRSVLTSSLKLESGFTGKVVTELIDDMIKIGHLTETEGHLYLTNVAQFGGEE